jgi:hypothetical protein
MKWTPLLALVLCACGSNTVAEGNGAGGGQPGESGTTAMPVSCTGTELGLRPKILAWPDSNMNSRDPSLARIDDASVALVTSLEPMDGEGLQELPVGHRRLSPWSGGSLVADDTHSVSNVGGRNRVVAEAGTEGGYAMFMNASADPGPPYAMLLARDLEPTDAYDPLPTGVDPAVSSEHPRFLVDTGERVILGWDDWNASPPDLTLGLTEVAGDTATAIDTGESGCVAGSGFFVDAVPVPGGAVIAMNSSRQAQGCGDPVGDAPANRLQTGRIDDAEGGLVMAEDAIQPHAIDYLEMASDIGSRWVFYNGGEHTITPVMAQRLDETGAFVEAPVEALSGPHSGPFGIAAIGDGFVFVHVDRSDADDHVLVVRVHDGSGEVVAEHEVTVPFISPKAEIDVTVGPDRHQILVAWTHEEEGTADAVGIARVDCLP